MTTGVSVRALASPGFALALVVLVLNDHVLKTAYPGWITGKLSDVAGLVVAPLLLGVLLTAWRVPRPMLVAIAVVGLGFTLTKSAVAVAAVASDLWSLTGVPSEMRADTTDLLALPALCAAWLVHRRVASSPTRSWRDIVARAIGVALLPVAVLATAATSCASDQGLENLNVVSGSFSPSFAGREERIGVSGYVMAGDGTLASLRPRVVDLPDEGVRRQVDAACDGDGTCWRIDPGVDHVPSVQVSTDGGATWTRDLWVTPDERDAALVDVPVGCNEEPSARLRDLVVLKDGTSVRVAVAASSAGMYMRTVGGRWTRLSLAEIGSRDTVRVRGELSAVEPHAPPHYPPPSLPGEEESLPPEETCAGPVTVSVTPHPQNGPPTTYVRCS
jgi:hypothetical protein